MIRLWIIITIKVRIKEKYSILLQLTVSGSDDQSVDQFLLQPMEQCPVDPKKFTLHLWENYQEGGKKN